jgi:hypothetical protein
MREQDGSYETPGHTVSGVTDLPEKYPGGLKTACEVSQAVKEALPAERIVELADAGYMPHWRIDDGPPMFKLLEVKDWIARNLARRIEGLQLPDEVRITYTGPKPDDLYKVPFEIRNIEGLCDITKHIDLGPGVYFLCRDEKVVYIGQSVTPAARAASHRRPSYDGNKDFNKVFFLPWPESDLDSIEGALIRAVDPEYNGNSPAGKPGEAAEKVVGMLNVS